MSIDWVTVAAQVANFLLLVWLLKKFLYRPILDGIEAREADIAQRMAAADAARLGAEQAQQEYQELQAKAAADHEALMEQTLAATEHQREELLARGRAQQVAEQQQWREYLEREKRAFFQRLEQAGGASLLAVSQKVIQELADETLESAIARQLLKRLQPLLPQWLESTAGHCQGEVRSHLPLAADTRQQLEGQLRAWIPDLELGFVEDLQQTPGVVLQVGGVQVSWTLDSYLDELNALLVDQSQQLSV